MKEITIKTLMQNYLDFVILMEKTLEQVEFKNKKHEPLAKAVISQKKNGLQMMLDATEISTCK